MATSTGELLQELSEDLATLVRQESELLRATVVEQARASAAGLALTAGGALAGGFAVAAVHNGIARSMSRHVPPLVAGLVLGLADVAVAAALTSTGIGLLRSRADDTRRVVQDVKEDIKWARHPTRSAATSPPPDSRRAAP
jgi:hypothetical protein